jgi:SagB-type dehydrogenase family enzyme
LEGRRNFAHDLGDSPQKRFSMNNMNTQAAWRYHNGTKHPNGYLLDILHTYNPLKRPLLFKDYLDLEPLAFPPDLSPRGSSTFKAISTPIHPTGEESLPDFDAMARVLHYSAGITKRITYPPPWGEIPFRAAACTGALYHIELYLVCGDLPGLEAGVYHYASMESALKQLRQGDYRRVLIEASEDEVFLKRAPAILVFTHVPWRNACKYQSRAYRHAFWDSGTILSQTLAAASSYGLPAKVILGFLDESVRQLLDLDAERELPVALAALGNRPVEALKPPGDLEPLSLAVRKISEDEMSLSAIQEMHLASSLREVGEVKAWREAPNKEEHPQEMSEGLPLDPLPEHELPGASLESVIIKRGSSRRFHRDSISYQQLSTILDGALESFSADFLNSEDNFLNRIYLIANAVEGLDPGAYVLQQEAKKLELLKPGLLREQAGHLALDQDLGADASVNVYFMISLREVLRRFGNRGYRAAQLEAAIRAGRIYLTAYALGLGATGLTFFDDEVTDFFSPHAMDKSVMFLIAVGVPVRRVKG